VAIRCIDMASVIPGSIKKKCLGCGQDVWVSKALQNKKVDGYVCTKCMIDVERESPSDITYKITDEVIDEYLEWLIRSGRIQLWK
jgi:hypothetical protein